MNSTIISELINVKNSLSVEMNRLTTILMDERIDELSKRNYLRQLSEVETLYSQVDDYIVFREFSA